MPDSMNVQASSQPMPLRRVWMATEGRKLFTEVTIAVIENLGRRPLALASPVEQHGLARQLVHHPHVSSERQLSTVMTQASTIAIAQPSVRLGGQSPTAYLKRHSEALIAYADLGYFRGGVGGFLEDSLRFARDSTLRAANLSLVALREFRLNNRQRFTDLESVLQREDFFDKVLQPLTQTNFGIVGNLFAETEAPQGQFTNLKLPRGTPIVEAPGGRLQLSKEAREGLRAALRTPTTPRTVSPVIDTTSSGCPVGRRATASEPSGTELMRDLVAASVRDSLALARELEVFERSHPTPELSF